jgi:phosphoglycolate phosphatase
LNTIKPYQAVLFDFDGTLLDTLEDLGAAVNRVLRSRGFPTHPIDAFRWFIGDGSAVLMERALPAEQRTTEQIHACLQALLADYDRNWHLATRPYDGILSLLETLGGRHLALAVVTNKPHPFTLKMLAHYFPRVPFGSVWGLQPDVPKKPDPFMALKAAAELGVTPECCIFLGDSCNDMQTARRAGMLPVGAGWGFRPVQELWETGAAHVIDHPLSLLEIL